MIKIRIPRWLVVVVWFGVVVPVQVLWEICKACWEFMAGDDGRASRWEWMSVALILIVVVGTLGSARGWWWV